MRIYISNFDLQFRDEDLAGLFTPYGAVESAEVALDGFTDKPRGFGYVEMPEDEQALAAIAALNKSLVNGRALQVHQAEPKEARKGSYKVGKGGDVRPYRFKKD